MNPPETFLVLWRGYERGQLKSGTKLARPNWVIQEGWNSQMYMDKPDASTIRNLLPLSNFSFYCTGFDAYIYPYIFLIIYIYQWIIQWDIKV